MGLKRHYGVNTVELKKLFQQIAQDNIDQFKGYYDFRGMPIPNLTEVNQLSTMLEASFNQTAGTMVNLASTTGFAIPVNGKTIYKPLQESYIELVDKAIQSTFLGEQSYQTAMRQAMRPLLESGVRTINYSTGYSKRLDTAVRESVLQGVRQLSLRVQEQVGKEFGADGYEISVKHICAYDHLDIQGKQYSISEYEKLNRTLNRPIGQLNCGHFAFPIILGVSESRMSKEDIENVKKDNKRLYKFENRSYTKYEGTQVQRKLETKMRKYKDMYMAYKQSGDLVEARKIKNKITGIRNEYVRFCNALGLYPQLDRASVSRLSLVRRLDFK